MRKTSDREILKSVSVVKESPAEPDIVAFSIVKNERFFIDAFFQHYRGLGVEKFLILDDGSTDGTLEYLLSQSDATVLQSSYSFGEIVNRRGWLPWRSAEMRAGIRLKALVPNTYLKNQWCIYADADEFLVLPSQFSNIYQLTRALDDCNRRVLLSVVVEMYPERISDLSDGPAQVSNFDELLALSPYFDAVQLLSISASGDVNRLNVSASGRLFRAHDVPFGGSNEVATLEEARSSAGKKKLAIGSAINKISLLKPGSGVKMVCGHWANVPPASEVALTVLHFKFTPDVMRRAEAALQSKAWANNSAKYSNYNLLFHRMKEAGASFLASESMIYRGADQLEATRNLWCNLPVQRSSRS